MKLLYIIARIFISDKRKKCKTDKYYMFTKFSEWIKNLQEDNRSIDYLQKSADKIAEIVGNKTVVILGRDAWFLVPLLKRRGVKVQYFLYSRLQLGDESTKEAWLREVPKGSYVVDTGYRGTIIDDIRSFDPSVKGLLFSSSNPEYPEIDVPDYNRHHRSDIVGDIEYAPKIIGRSRGFKGDNVIVNKRSYGMDDVDSLSMSVPDVISKNEKTLKDLGLPDEDVETYKKFTGIPINQRIQTPDTFSHLMDVELSRYKEKQRDLREKYKSTKKPNKEDIKSFLHPIVDNIIKTKNINGYSEIKRHFPQHQQRTAFHYFLQLVNNKLQDSEDDLRKCRNLIKSTPKWDEDSFKELSEFEETILKNINFLKKLDARTRGEIVQSYH